MNIDQTRAALELGLLDSYDPLFVAVGTWQCSCAAITVKVSAGKSKFLACPNCLQLALVVGAE